MYLLAFSAGRILLRIADEFAVSVITTNFTSKSRGDSECKPALGVSWVGIPSTRVWLRRNTAGTAASAAAAADDDEPDLQITATVVKSNRLASGTVALLRI